METKFPTGLRKNHNTQQALLRMIENCKAQLNKKKGNCCDNYGPLSGI